MEKAVADPKSPKTQWVFSKTKKAKEKAKEKEKTKEKISPFHPPLGEDSTAFGRRIPEKRGKGRP